MYTNMKQPLLFSMLLATSLTAGAQKIDFNFANKPESQVNEPGYSAWAVNTCESETKTFELR